LPAVVFINTLLPVDRLRFSLAHELGHLVCHDVPNPQQEIQANQFASEFLMPSDDIADDLRDFSLNKAMELKLYWGTSMQALTHKAWELGIISDSRYKNCLIEMSRRGWRKNEPIEARGFREIPSIFASIIETFMEGLGYSEYDLADLFGIMVEDLRFYFPIKERRPILRVIVSN
jgi:Zn-dependent peptidase ImmA (M78 family)